MTDTHSNAAVVSDSTPIEPFEPWDSDLGERLSRHTAMLPPVKRWLQWVLAIPFLVDALGMFHWSIIGGGWSPVLIIAAILTASAVTLFGFVHLFKQVLKQFLWMRRLHRNGMAETLLLVPESHVLLQQAADAQWHRILRQTAYPLFASCGVFVLTFSLCQATMNGASGWVNWDILGAGLLSLFGVLIFARVAMLLPYLGTWAWISAVVRGAVMLLLSVILMELMDELVKDTPSNIEMVHLIAVPFTAGVAWWFWVLQPIIRSTGKGMALRWQCASNGWALWSLITPP